MITFIIKCTDGCNLRCRYCSVGKKQVKPHLINEETLRRTADYIAEYVRRIQENEAKIILHGGEPTIVDSRVYRTFFEYAIEKYSDVSWLFAMQTNGYNISEDMLQLFKDYSVNIGVSIDGNQEVHDRTRLTEDGRKSFSVITGNMERLIQNGIHVSGLIVLTKELLKEDLSYLLYFNYHDIHLKINPILNYGEATNEDSLWLSPGDYAKYLISVFRYALNMELEINIAPITEMFKAVVNQSPMHDCSYRQSCGKSIACVDWQGAVYPCGRYRDIHAECVGNVLNGTVFHPIERCSLTDDCRTCRYLKWCNNGCEAYRRARGEQKNPFCKDVQMLFDFFADQGIAEYIEYLKRKKETLIGMMEEGDTEI